ncbi:MULTISPECIES: hypothetical protein [Saccharopolyspora]|uniref:Uncharacterized protein n=1 Tax=Saccharopolyspora elongata TaxID=2530387 RepID=A0A4R4XW10_9PSEU|nr:hypothetical protein [Saccharopolyspora elongata]TDD35685.1 hypothetical protein E1288_42845 [Saccharopolyspora elongata]
MSMRPRSVRAALCGPALLAALAAPAGCAEAPTNFPVAPVQVQNGEVTVRGVVRSGVEQGCLVLATADREYLLVHPPSTLRPGVTAVVRGRIETGMVTTCMQGTPLVVSEAHTG